MGVHNLEALEAKRAELIGKINIFIGVERHKDILAKFESQLKQVEAEIELAKRLQDDVAKQEAEAKLQAEGIQDSILLKLYDKVGKAIDDVQFMMQHKMQCGYTFNELKKNMKKLEEREQLFSKAYPDKDISKYRPDGINKLLKTYKAMEAKMQEQVLDAKKQAMKLSDKEKAEITGSSISGALDFLSSMEGDE